MPINFSIAKRGSLPTEEKHQNVSNETEMGKLRPQLECLQTVNVVDFQSGSSRLPSMLPKGELMAALSTIQNVMLHELERGNAVLLPGIGTFRLSLKGDIEVKDGNYHGLDVRVDGLQFRPAGDFLSKVRGFEVDQVPFGLEFRAESSDIEARLAELFADKDFITHKDISVAFKQTLTRGRITTLLNRLVREGRLVPDGKGAQTRYRLA